MKYMKNNANAIELELYLNSILHIVLIKLCYVFFIIKHNSSMYIYNIFTFARTLYLEKRLYSSIYKCCNVTCLTVSTDPEYYICICTVL